ncbi:STAS/SEC14 domain-containing protein [Hymenobacter sp. 15J16-1T3B]|uniref:STAS/SEC14 domain-containing protein n=1 Tax=Hymenobacter sp. 15J16-1T3B TaxID=2886941 RepID=UPI001D12F0D4|nr:STAS/SEC14 domain-containing protein [Hymenobacter sp. 15J16-1T3B]MCC3160287.1 STAS/SEC14 domain-containing protein [Hymenobacter sp. 15J16-1T3B]
MQPLLSLPYLSVFLHPGPALETQWLGFATSAEFRAAIKQLLALGQAHRVRGWLADDRLLGAVRPRDLDWSSQHLLAGLDRAGLQRFALVESQDVLNRHTITRMYEQVVPAVGFEIRRFAAIEQARAWAAGGA